MIILLTWIKPSSSNLVFILAKKLLAMILRRSLIFVDSMLTCRLGSCLLEVEIKVSLLIESTIMYCIKVNFVIYASDTAFNPLMTIVLKEINNYLKIYFFTLYFPWCDIVETYSWTELEMVKNNLFILFEKECQKE